jgi:phosphatidate cytidylyltransferase
VSPRAALDSRIFLSYVIIVAVLLVAGAVALALMKWVFRKDARSVFATWRSWMVMAPLCLGGLFLGRIAFIALITAVSLLAFKEFARATGLYRDWLMTGTVDLGILAVGVTSLVSQPQGEESGTGWYGLFIALPVFAIAAILLIPILRNRIEGQLQNVSLAIVGFVYIGWMFGHLAFLANADEAYGYILYIVFATELNDVAAFTFGKLLGKHPLRGRISPKKTWEGALGALATSMALPWLLWWSFPHFGVTQLVLAGLIAGVGGQLGDLAISVIKRDIGVKDMGATIPGHGGVLDRIDSLIYTAPLFFHMAGYFYGLR